MSHELHASIRLSLPDEPKEQASTLAKVTAEWGKLIHAIEGVDATFTVGRSAPPVVRRRRGRPRKGPNGDAALAVDAFERAVAAS